LSHSNRLRKTLLIISCCPTVQEFCTKILPDHSPLSLSLSSNELFPRVWENSKLLSYSSWYLNNYRQQASFSKTGDTQMYYFLKYAGNSRFKW
jgi:hypothetical protein